jgi:hypothetical protein
MAGVERPTFIQGRWWTPEQLETIRQLIAEHPGWSRNKLSIALSEQLEWRTASGQLRDMAARHLLNKLAARQWIELPARQKCGGKQPLRILQNQQLEFFSASPPELIAQSLASLQPLEFVLIEPRQPGAADFVRYLAQHHYLGFGGDTGPKLRYMVRDRQGRDLACALFSAAAWQVRARDAFIGWSSTQRRERLGLLINNTRFLILPHVQTPHLASHILGRLLRRVRQDWQRKYALAPALAETFVERERFAGTCYRAANWRCVGQSCGRSRGDRAHRLQVPIKDIYLYALQKDFRQRLCA